METSGGAEQQTSWLVLLGSCSVFGELPYEEEERQIIFLIIRTLWYRKLFCHSVSHWWHISRSSWLFTPSVPWHRISCVTPISCDFQAPRSCSVMLSPAPGPYVTWSPESRAAQRSWLTPRFHLYLTEKQRCDSSDKGYLHLINYFLCLPEL